MNKSFVCHLARCRWLVCALGALALMPASLWAQPQGGARVYEEQLRVQLDKLPEAREIGFDAGGWFNYVLMSYDDQASLRHRTLQQFQARGWASLNVKGVHKFYVRGLLNWDVWAHNASTTSHGDYDFSEQIERAWYEFDLGQLMLNQTGRQQAFGLKVKVGREYTTIGTALVLSMPMDMVDFNLTIKNWETRAFLGKSIKDSDNMVDDSPFINSHQDRCFWGFETRYRGFTSHRPFAYFLNNIDHSSPSPWDANQKYDYSSRYLGIGSEGSIILPDLTYKAEVVGEWGRTYSDGMTTSQDDICAMAADFQLEYFFKVPTSPKIMAEYIWASGDGDRNIAGSTVGGNLAGTKDRAFNAFGFRDTGIAFAPQISNINVYVVGARFNPLEKYGRIFKKMELGSKVFFYQKDKADGAISDSTATQNSSWLGWEWDVYCNWRVTSDLSWTMRYGVFQPGAAYDNDNDSCRHFLYTGLTLSF